LHGRHFDIAEPGQRIEAMIAPVNGGGIYYCGPCEDWSRPGRCHEIFACVLDLPLPARQ